MNPWEYTRGVPPSYAGARFMDDMFYDEWGRVTRCSGDGGFEYRCTYCGLWYPAWMNEVDPRVVDSHEKGRC